MRVPCRIEQEVISCIDDSKRAIDASFKKQMYAVLLVERANTPATIDRVSPEEESERERERERENEILRTTEKL